MDPIDVEVGVEIPKEISAMAHCYDHYHIPLHTHDNLIIALADND